MPTFFGPTNIPVLEAWALGCPVLTSDIRGIREQVRRCWHSGGSALRRIHSQRHLQAVDVNSLLPKRLSGEAHQRLANYTPADYRARLVENTRRCESFAVRNVPKH